MEATLSLCRHSTTFAKGSRTREHRPLQRRTSQRGSACRMAARRYGSGLSASTCRAEIRKHNRSRRSEPESSSLGKSDVLLPVFSSLPLASLLAFPETSHAVATAAADVTQQAETSQLLLDSPLASLLTSPVVVGSIAEAAVGESTGYSPASYWTSLALFIISIPGLWSLIKRATKSKIVRKTFQVPGPAADGGKPMAALAGEITASLGRSQFFITNAGEVVTFEGKILPNRGQAAFLTFCTAISLACIALVLTITNPDVGEWWYSMVALSPLAGAYYWRKAERMEQIQVKIVIADDEQTADVTIQGDEEELEKVRRELDLKEKGLDYIKGILEA